MAKTDFRKQIQSLIKEKEISVAKLARMAGIHHQTLYNYLNEDSEMGASTLGKLFDLLYETKKEEKKA